MPSLASVSGSFTAAEHFIAVVIRIVFTLSELTLIGCAFTSIVAFIHLYMTVLGFPTPFEFLAAIITPAVLWLVLQKVHSVLRTALFDVLRHRVERREARALPRLNVALDATGAGGSPVAVSVDVDHDEPAPRA